MHVRDAVQCMLATSIKYHLIDHHWCSSKPTEYAPFGAKYIPVHRVLYPQRPDAQTSHERATQ